MLLCRFVVGTLSVGLMVLGAGVVSAQDYPNKTIRIFTGTPGGGADFATRQIAQGISGPLGQPVVVENRGGVVTAETVAKAAPDGYTLSLNGANLWISTLLQKLSYDVVRDFSPITLATRDAYVLAVHPSLPVKSVKELIALAKAKPGELNYAISGANGSTTHLMGELFKSMAGINIVHIPYKGPVPAITALISGEAHLMMSDGSLAPAYAKSGRLRILAVTTTTPTALFPGLPTLSASGLPGYEFVGVSGVFAPIKTPGAIINRLNQEIVRFLSLPEVKERFLNSGTEVVSSSPDEFAALIKSDIAKLGKLIKDTGISAN